MKSGSIRLFFIVFCVLLSMVLFVCSTDIKINFYCYSAIQNTINSITESFSNKNTVTRSSGMVIYKDNSGSKDKDSNNIKFGPGDVKFDLPMNIK